jgi:hypothetical protein
MQVRVRPGRAYSRFPDAVEVVAPGRSPVGATEQPSVRAGVGAARRGEVRAQVRQDRRRQRHGAVTCVGIRPLELPRSLSSCASARTTRSTGVPLSINAAGSAPAATQVIEVGRVCGDPQTPHQVRRPCGPAGVWICLLPGEVATQRGLQKRGLVAGTEREMTRTPERPSDRGNPDGRQGRSG